MKTLDQNIISAIVPVYNEERTVSGVIETLLNFPEIDEVICVNDGSSDKSINIIRAFQNRIQIIDLKRNHGKGYALSQGIKKAKGNIIVFIDADLVNLTGSHLQTLLDPVLKSKARAVLGYPSNKDHPRNVFAKLTGERVYFKKDLIPHLAKFSGSRFGVEVYLNRLFKEKEVKKIPLENLKGLLKYEKRNSKDALTEYLNEAVEIAREIGNREVLTEKDKEIIKKIAKAINKDDFRNLVGKLYNKTLRQYMEKYVLKYINRDFFR